MIKSSYKGTREETTALSAYVKLVRAAEALSSTFMGI